MKVAPPAIWRRRDGNVTVMLAGALMMLFATSALGIDTATVFLEKRRLQGIADAAALSAAADPQSGGARAEAAVRANAHGDARIVATTTGSFAPDPAVAIERRFVAGGEPANAVRVTMDSSVATVFARIFGGSRSTVISARATAARVDLAGFSIGSRLAAVGGGLPNALLSTLAGSELNLSVMDYNALVGGRVEVLRLMEQLRARMSLDVATFGDVLATDIALPKAIEAMAAATADTATAQTLRALARAVPNRTIRLDAIIDLGPLGDRVRADPDRPMAADAYTLLREMLSVGSPTRQVESDLQLNIPGIASSRVWLEIGERPAATPWLAVSAARKATVRTAQARLWIDIRLAAAAPLGLGSVRLPVFVELAQAEATLVSVSCAGGRANAGATLAVTPALGQIAIADVDTAGLSGFTHAATLRPARVVTSPIASVTAFSTLQIGGTRAQDVHFPAADIAAHTPRTVSTNDAVGGVAASLLRTVDLNANIVGLGLSAGVVANLVGGVLSAAAPAIDGVIDQVTALAGVRFGQADAWIDGVRCGTPVLVE